MTDLKAAVRAHWEAEPCGTRALPGEDRRAFFAALEQERYRVEPYIPAFAGFASSAGLRVLEVGVGAGTDFVQWPRGGARATGVDLTDAGVRLCRERLALEGRFAPVFRADAERLPFADRSFDLVYSYGVLHHSPDTRAAIREVHRVLRPGGTARIMIYHHPSWVGLMLWGVHGAARGQPFLSPREAVFQHLESPGTKAYTLDEARALFADFSTIDLQTRVGPGDTLDMPPSAKYQGRLHALAWKLYPRALIRRFGDRLGLGLFIEARK